jgi:Protein of unknown function (DUF3710)
MVFRRRRQRGSDASGLEAQNAEVEPEPIEQPEKTPRPDGPFDSAEMDLVSADAGRVDLGGMLVRPAEGMRLQLQVDERSGTGTGVMIVDADAAVAMIAVAAPRSYGLWEQRRGGPWAVRGRDSRGRPRDLAGGQEGGTGVAGRRHRRTAVDAPRNVPRNRDHRCQDVCPTGQRGTADRHRAWRPPDGAGRCDCPQSTGADTPRTASHDGYAG